MAFAKLLNKNEECRPERSEGSLRRLGDSHHCTGVGRDEHALSE